MSAKQRYSLSEKMCEGVVRRQSNSAILDKTWHGGEGDNKQSSFLHYTCFHWIRYPLKICKFRAVSSRKSVERKKSLTKLKSMSNASSAFLSVVWSLFKKIAPKNKTSVIIYAPSRRSKPVCGYFFKMRTFFFLEWHESWVNNDNPPQFFLLKSTSDSQRTAKIELSFVMFVHKSPLMSPLLSYSCWTAMEEAFLQVSESEPYVIFCLDTRKSSGPNMMFLQYRCPPLLLYESARAICHQPVWKKWNKTKTCTLKGKKWLNRGH